MAIKVTFKDGSIQIIPRAVRVSADNYHEGMYDFNSQEGCLMEQISLHYQIIGRLLMNPRFNYTSEIIKKLRGEIMSKRFFVDETVTENGKYRVLQEDSETREHFGVKDFDTKEEAQSNVEIMQKAADDAFSEEDTLRDIEIPIGEISNTADESEFKDTPQDLKDETSQD